MDEYGSQSDVVAFLRDPATHGLSDDVQVITTHSAHVFLAGDRAYKIKRPVKFNYLDFTALATRAEIIAHELELNAPAAPMIYDRVVVITREADGRLAMDGAGEPAEYALAMHRFERENELTHIADAGDFTVALAEKLGEAVAAFHAKAPRRDPDGGELIREILDELEEAFEGMETVLGHDRLAGFSERSEAAFALVAALLTERSRQGFVRRCHGDLHLKNIVMIEGRPVPFDALEFDERLGTTDVFYDFAFLVMDLLHRGLAAPANALMGRYLARTGDVEGLAALPLFLGVRAAIRGMVAVQTMSGEVADGLALEARGYLDDAIGFLAPGRARLVAIGGVSGTGKTSAAARIAPGLGPAPGALHLRSDLERKAMFAVDPLEPLPQEAYEKPVSDEVYRRLLDQAGRALDAGHAVILDATFLDPAERAAAQELARAHGVAFDGLWLDADRGTLERRVAARENDASDADVSVLRLQLEKQPVAGDWARSEAGDSLENTVSRARAALDRG